MKKNFLLKRFYLTFIFVSLCAALGFDGCKKSNDEVKVVKDKAKSIHDDDVKSVSINPKGVAQILTYGGGHFTQYLIKNSLSNNLFHPNAIGGAVGDTVKAVLEFKMPIRIKNSTKTSGSLATSSISDGEGSSDGYGPNFTARVTQYSNGYTTVTLNNYVQYGSDYSVRATVLGVSQGTNPVHFDVNYRYVYSDGSSGTSQGEYMVYLY